MRRSSQGEEGRPVAMVGGTNHLAAPDNMELNFADEERETENYGGGGGSYTSIRQAFHSKREYVNPPLTQR